MRRDPCCNDLVHYATVFVRWIHSGRRHEVFDHVTRIDEMHFGSTMRFYLLPRKGNLFSGTTLRVMTIIVDDSLVFYKSRLLSFKHLRRPSRLWARQ
eukprot:1470604-Amphidinium_carterae.1